jgi:hypothetical protein
MEFVGLEKSASQQITAYIERLSKKRDLEPTD